MDSEPQTPGSPAEEAAQIGVDQWVAQADARRQEHPGLRGRIVRLWRMLPPAGKLALLTPAIAVPFLPISQGDELSYDYGEEYCLDHCTPCRCPAHTHLYEKPAEA